MKTISPAVARWLEARAKSEAQFLREVGALLTDFGWAWHHCRPAWTEKGWRTPIQGTPGFMDIVAARALPIPRLLLIELKTERGKLTPAQRAWRAALGAAERRDWEYYCFCPSQWGEIVEVLK